jgi:TRAP-type C4-dicarboxylate transport system permease small subunit
VTGARQRAQRIAAAWNTAEQWILGGLAAGMVLLAAVQIVLRDVFHTGLRSAETCLGAGLLWVTMLGALAATGARKHITIDIVSPFLPPRAKAVCLALADLFASGVCAWLARAAVRYVALQRSTETAALLPGVPAWAPFVIIPVCLGLMAWRFALHAALNAALAAGGARGGSADGRPEERSACP